MLDFVEFRTRPGKKDHIDVYPEFMVKRTNDLMIRGHSFYAMWDEENYIWTRDEYRVQEMIDNGLYEYAQQFEDEYIVSVKYMRDSSTKSWENFMRYCKNAPDRYHDLDDKIIFLHDEVKREDYASKRLKYDLTDCDISAYDELVSTLYSPEERLKFEWAIGSVFAGKSKDIQKFLVFYGSAGTGKSTILNIIEKLFDGYYIMFDSKSLVSNKDFALEQFKSNPLVAIQHDGDLSRVDDNSKLNSLVSHENMTINEKFKAQYTARNNALLFLGTNKPVQITDAKSGLIRRLIDVSPTGNLVSHEKYNKLVNEIDFEIGGIAKHCLDVFEMCGELYFDGYRAEVMMGATNEFYNYVEDNWDFFTREKFVTLSEAWKRYKLYCEDANSPYPLRKMVFKNELKNYFEDFKEHTNYASNVYIGFVEDRFKSVEYDPESEMTWLWLEEDKSILDDIYKDCPAQYATKGGVPRKKWSNVKTTLSEIDTSQEHYVIPPENHIVIDFDFKDADGNKDSAKNIQEAEKWPKTYAEFSKSGGGVHLHYIYTGDGNELQTRINESVEIKRFIGNSALRRRLTKCNDIPIATISSGLPIKEGGQNVVDFKGFTSEKALRNHILKCMRKEHHGATKPEVDFIFKALEDAYNSGLSYDLTTLRPKVLTFAMGSTNQKDICLKLVNKMHFASDDKGETAILDDEQKPIAFYDVEVFPNLFLVNWKFQGDHQVVRMINPSSEEIEDLVKKTRLIGFNCRRYDNHIMYGRMLGYSNQELYELSQRIIFGSNNAFFGQAYNLSYTDVYDFAASYNKKSLKKFEIELGLHHQELGLPWDQPVDESLWNKVAEYCDNDVISTEAVFNHLQGDWIARQILAELSGLTPNDSTNSHSKRIIFEGNRHPQNEFIYTDLSEMFPGYKFDAGKSTYRGIEVGEGGYVWAKPGMYANVTTFDVASMHPTSIEELNLFGDRYTKRFGELKQARLHIKRNELDELNYILDGKLVPFLQAIKDGTAKYTTKDLSNALKTVINSIYGLTSAKFDNEFKDPRNVDNIVAKRGALFMVDLQKACEEKGIKAIHIKTDSIKVVDATEEQANYILEFGKKYGYEFEIESKYERICLVNNSVYIAKEADGGWTATGSEFADPYIFKTLFSHEPLEYRDYWQTKESHKGDMFLDMNEDLGEGEHDYHFIGRTGAFVPITPGGGGGELVAQRDDKYVAVSGSKGYRWLDVETVVALDKQDEIDINYFGKMVDEAVEHLAEFGDVDQFLDTSVTLVNNFVDVPEGLPDTIPFFEDQIEQIKKED